MSRVRATEFKHGVPSGYVNHTRRKEVPCKECLEAWRDYYAKKREQKA